MAEYRLFERSSQAKLYLKFRPEYPKKTVETILTYLSKKRSKPFQLAVDIGCGGGQSTRPLAPYFDKVIGFDVSEAQLENAKKGENATNIEYRTGGGENIPLPASSADLITCAQSVHWFNFQVFCDEVDRVLKPSGCVALYGYDCFKTSCSDKDLTNKLNDEVLKFYSGTLAGCWTDRAKHTENHYADFIIPYPENERIDDIEINKEITVSEYIGDLRTTSAYWTYLEKHPHLSIDPLDELQSRIMQILNADTSPDQTPITVKNVVFMLLGRKPGTANS